MDLSQKKRIVFDKLKIEVKKFFRDNQEKFNQGNLELTTKDDQSKVTFFDIELSKLIIKIVRTEFPNICIYSEEHHENLNFPAFIIDPIDGTKEFAQGIPECAVSIAYMEERNLNNEGNHAWIYNPFNGFEIESNQGYLKSKGTKKEKYICFVSRTEWGNGEYRDLEKNNRIIFSSKGSIAYKLGLLASGACELIISRYPKNIWDIAAGIIINIQNGISFYENKIKQESIKDKYNGKSNLIWANETVLKDIQL